MNVDELKKLINGRDVYIWGTRIAGLSAAKILPAHNIKVKAFVDSIPCSHGKLGIAVLLPEELFAGNLQDRFVIICTRGHSPHIAKKCMQDNMTRNDFVEWEELQRFDYYIEINNKCNLNCLTCSAREYYNELLVNMPTADFEAVLRKIRREDSLASWVHLFGHNEAFLNNSLAEMVEISNNLNFAVGLSTNLAFSKDFKNVIKAKPLWIRVSMSGWGENYEVIHRGGKFDILLRNLNLLNKYREQYSKDTIIEVFFHRYKHNENDIKHVKELCDCFDFEFRCIYASIIGIETVSNILDGRAVSLKTQKALSYLCHSVPHTAKQALKQKDFPCPEEHLVRIHSDLTVAECQAWMGSVMPRVKFTDISFDKLERKLANTRFCPICKPRGLHQFCEVVFDENLVNKNETGI